MIEKQVELEYEISEKVLKKKSYELFCTKIFIAVCFFLTCISQMGVYTDFFKIFLPVIIFSGIAALGFLYFIHRDYSFLKNAGLTCNEDGLWYTSKNKQETIVRWSEVHSIKKAFILNQNHLLDKNGKNLLIIDYRLDDVAELNEILARHGTSLFRGTLPFETKRKTGEQIEFYSIAIFVLVLCVFCYVNEDYFLFVFFTALVFFGLYSTLKNQIQGIKITQDSIVIKYLFYQKEIKKESIVSIDFFDTVDNNQQVSNVYIHTLKDKYLQSIDGMKADQFVLYRVLVKAFPKSQ